MSQVIQGNNLRCLFTDTPPSLQQAYPRMSRSSLSLYDGGGGGSPGPCPGPYAAYAQHQYPQLPAQQLPQQTLHHGRGVGGHDECKDHSPVARANRHYATTIRPCRPASTTSPQSSTSHCIHPHSLVLYLFRSVVSCGSLSMYIRLGLSCFQCNYPRFLLFSKPPV